MTPPHVGSPDSTGAIGRPSRGGTVHRWFLSRRKRILPRTADELNLLISTGFVAEHAGRIVGFSALEIYSRKLAEIRSLCVDPSAQGLGIGRRLVEECLELGRKLNVFEVMVITSEESFFRSSGFDFTLPGEKKALFQQLRTDH